jgi:hypothetical protein
VGYTATSEVKSLKKPNQYMTFQYDDLEMRVENNKAKKSL